jgi:hypothetical protein
MIPLLIHLPPPSDDIDAGGRDARDLADENISRAQVLYNIIASTSKKGFKSNFYGQRHISLEIIAAEGFVHFYTAVPLNLVPIVEQAIVSAYPTARLEEVAEHNMFSPVGKISGTMGGELVLKEDFAFPIANYQDVKRDTMQTVLNALSTLEKEDGVGIQILLRPAHSSWRKHATGIASKKRKGKEKKKGGEVAFWWMKQLATAPVKPPEDKSKSSDQGGPQLSSMDQALVDAIDDKTKHPGFEVLIRIVASSNISQRSQVVLNNINASFALFDAPGRNGFKFVPAKDIESFVTSFILRLFPQEQNSNVLNTVEMASLFHFPDQSNIPTSQLQRQASKQVDGPRNVSDEGLVLGYNVFRGAKKRINLDPDDRRRHVYIVGQTGTGKSVFLKNIAIQDMLNGEGFAFIDPHGDAVDELLGKVPKERAEDVIYFNPAEMDFPLGLNLFEFDSPDQKDFLIQEAIGMLYKLYDPQHQGIIGPRYEHWFRSAALTLMSDPEGSSFIDIPKVFTDNDYAKQKIAHVKDQTVLDFWNKEMASTNDYHKSEVLGWFVSKFSAFLSNEMMRNIIGQTKSSFNLRDVMDNKKILLVNLSKGRTGELNSKLLGMIFVMKFQAAAMSRADIPESERVPFSLYVDEFQNYSTDSFAEILSEARKYGLNLIVANQFISQLTEEIRDAVFGNVGTIVSFRVGTNDAEFLSKQFTPVFDIDDLQRIPNHNTVMRMLIGGVPTQPFSMATLPPLGEPNVKLAEALKQLSLAKYGRPKAVVEAEIFNRLATKEAPKPPVNAEPSSMRPLGSTTPGQPLKQPGASSFLDEWLAKRKAKEVNNSTATPLVTPKIQEKLGHSPQLAPVSAPVQTSPPKDIAKPQEPQRATEEVAVRPLDAPVQTPQASPLHGELNHDDTIHIDRDGTFKSNEE